MSRNICLISYLIIFIHTLILTWDYISFLQMLSCLGLFYFTISIVIQSGRVSIWIEGIRLTTTIAAFRWRFLSYCLVCNLLNYRLKLKVIKSFQHLNWIIRRYFIFTFRTRFVSFRNWPSWKPNVGLSLIEVLGIFSYFMMSCYWDFLMIWWRWDYYIVSVYHAKDLIHFIHDFSDHIFI